MYAFKSLHKLNNKLPDWEKAEQHARSIQVGRPADVNHEIQDMKKQCQCCGNIIQKTPISICQNTKELQFIGIGFPLYFIFSKYCIILLLLESLSVSIIKLSDAIDNNYDFCINHVPKIIPNQHEQSKCTSYFVYLASLQEYLNRDNILLRVAYFAITIIFFIYMRDNLVKLIGYFDQRATTFSDYTLLLKKLPQKKNIKADLYKMLQNYQVCKIVVIGQIDHIQKIEKQIQQKQLQHKKILQKIEEQGNGIANNSQLIKKKENLQIKIQHLRQVFLQIVINEQKNYQNDQVFPQKIIICVQTDQQKQQIIEKIKKKQGLSVPEGWSQEDMKNIHAAQAPQPKQIIWQNLNVVLQKKVRNHIIGWAVTLAILAVISTIFYFAQVNLSSMIEHEAEGNIAMATIVFYIVLVTIIFINKFIISPLLHKICHFEKYFTKTKEEYGFTLKYLLCMFFTTAVMTVLVEVITKKNIYSHNFGVVENETIMIILTSFLIPLIWLINPWTIWIRARLMWLRGRKEVSQEEANKAMEAMPYQMGKRYAEVVKLVWLVSLYQSLLPLGTLLAALGLVFYYWVDKYNLLRRSAVKEAVSGFLTLRVMTLLEFSLILKCSGEILFDTQIRREYSMASIICLIIGLIYFILPKNQILNFIHGQRFNSEDKTFTECSKTMGVSYQDLHPVLGKKMAMMVEQSLNQATTQTDRQFDTNTYSIAKSILNQSNMMESQIINTKLKLWKKQFLNKNTIIRQSLLYKSNIDSYDI